MTSISYVENPAVENTDLNSLFENAWPDHMWRDFKLVLQHSLVYVCAFDGTRLIGFVNVAWDGGFHAFILDTTVHREFQHRGVGLRLVAEATRVAASRGVEWLHVDFEPELEEFYQKAGFLHTTAGLQRLPSSNLTLHCTGRQFRCAQLPPVSLTDR